MRVVGNIASDSEVVATASGAITAGKPVIVNSNGTVAQGGITAPTTGSEVVLYTNGTNGYSSLAYAGDNIQTTDDANKVVIVFQDASNSNYGTAMVGTVSGTSISFGSKVVFESASVTFMDCCMDSVQGKLLVFYRDSGNSSYGTGVVGTVSGTSISFGSPSVFNSAAVSYIGCEYDNYNQKALVAYRDQGNSNYGVALTADHQLNYGTEATFESASVTGLSVSPILTDPSDGARRFLISYIDGGNSAYGTGIVATISGSNVSYGSPVVFQSAGSDYINSTADTTNNKIVVGYRSAAGGATTHVRAVVATMSGTSVSFGTPVAASSNNTYPHGNPRSVAYSPDTGRVAIVYFDSSDSTHGKIILGTVSGTSISFGTEFKFAAATTYYPRIVYNKGTDNFVLSFEDWGNGGYFTSVVVDEGDAGNVTSENFIGFAKDAVADGAVATLHTANSISRNQSSLTAGQTYFVQTDGTLSETADSPSITAGTAISATELIVKG